MTKPVEVDDLDFKSVLSLLGKDHTNMLSLYVASWLKDGKDFNLTVDDIARAYYRKAKGISDD